MRTKKEVKENKIKEVNEHIIYKCEKCGYENERTFLNIFENKEYRYCAKCVHEFYLENFPKAILKK